jgi:hypothetical protein
MLYTLPRRVKQIEVNRSVYQYAALSFVLFLIVSFSACSGNSVPPAAPSTPPPTTTPAVDLTISATLPAATVNAAYAGSLTVTGGTAPYSFAVASGELPTGVLLTGSSGAVTGMPTASGNFSFTVSVSDAKGDSQQKSLQITVAAPASSSGSGSGTSNGSNAAAGNNGQSSFSSLQRSGGWGQYAQREPTYVDCSPSPCDGISFWMGQNISSPSLSGQASEFNVHGSGSFGDALFNNHLIGPGSTQGMPDDNQTIVPSLHNFTYDVYFYGDNMSLSQALEFDINQFFDGKGYIWGHECRIAGGNEWDVWDNQNQHWTHTGVPCYPNSNAWNHVTLKVQRNSNDELVYESITLNGDTSNLGWTFPHGSTPNWYGLTVNYQMDGNVNTDSYNIYLDNLTFSYN